MIAEVPICRINPNPASARKIDFNPRVQTALGPTIFYIDMKLAQKSAHNPNGETDFAQNRSAQQGRISASARAELDRFSWRSGFSFQPYFVCDLRMKRRRQLNKGANGVSLSVKAPNFVGFCLFLRTDYFIGSENALFIRCVLEWKLNCVRSEQEMEGIPRPKFKLQRDANLQNFSRLRKKTVCHQIIKQIAAILDIAFQID